MTIKRFRPNVGRARIPSSDTSSTGDFSRSVRDQMRQVTKNFEDWVAHMEDVSPDVLEEALKPTFALSQVYVPKDTKRLMRSGYLEKRQFRGRTVVEIGYARGGDPFYGVFVHENLEVHHAEPTRAKFLQAAIEEDASGIVSRIASGYKEASGV